MAGFETESGPSGQRSRSSSWDSGPSDSANHPSLKDAAAEHIRKEIVSGRLAPGDRVDQDSVAGILGISRLPVREALIELAQRGFVIARPRRGAFVVELTAQDVEDNFEILGSLEALAARRAAGSLGDEELIRLRRLCDQLADVDNRRAVDVVVRKFMSILIGSGRSRLLLAMHDSVLSSLPSCLHLASPGAVSTIRDRLETLTSALEKRDATSAAKAAEHGMALALAETMDLLRTRRYWESTTPSESVDVVD
ncbi:MAG TPA: GntR family transcriptional regulator [Myxococcota bacterium]|nr:GntR family transcriptional regulator [Myxococcales bacterium]HPG28102.1 GntR family transcriptional regulator [Myxococcota bacterium]